MSKETAYSKFFKSEYNRVRAQEVRDNIKRVFKNPKTWLRLAPTVVGAGAGFIATNAYAESNQSSEYAPIPSSIRQDLDHLHNFDTINGNPGAIWTTDENCVKPPQDDNHYAIGEDVWVRGQGFYSNENFNVTDKGQPGGASCDPNQEVARQSVTTNNEGDFCINLYTVQADDCGEYKINADVQGGSKNDNYRVEGAPLPTETSVPTKTPESSPTPKNSPTATRERTEVVSPTPELTSTVTNTPRVSETSVATVTSTIPPTALTETSTVTPTAFTETSTPAPQISVSPTITETVVCEPCPTCGTTEGDCVCNALETIAAAQTTLASNDAQRFYREETQWAYTSTPSPTTVIENLANISTGENTNQEAQTIVSQVNNKDSLADELAAAAVGGVVGFVAGTVVGSVIEKGKKKDPLTPEK